MGALKLIPFKMCEIKVDPSVSSFATANLKKFPPACQKVLNCPHLLLGIQIRNMKMVFNFYCTWCWVTFKKTNDENL